MKQDTAEAPKKKKKKAKKPTKVISRVTCKLCGEAVKKHHWRKHLMTCHTIFERDINPRFSKFFNDPEKPKVEKINKDWWKEYNKEKTKSGFLPCGTVVDGAPEAKIIYNPVCTSRRKH